MFKKLAFAAASAIALSAVSANAAVIVTIDASGNSGTFTSEGTSLAASFTEMGSFITPMGKVLASATVSSVASSAASNVNFLTALLSNGNGSFNFTPVSTGTVEFRQLLNANVTPGGSNTLTFTGTSGVDGKFTGTLSFTDAVPEPATWLMMMAGFGAMGFALRRQKAASRRVNFNFA